MGWCRRRPSASLTVTPINDRGHRRTACTLLPCVTHATSSSLTCLGTCFLHHCSTIITERRQRNLAFATPWYQHSLPISILSSIAPGMNLVGLLIISNREQCIMELTSKLIDYLWSRYPRSGRLALLLSVVVREQYRLHTRWFYSYSSQWLD